jgi:hypothetical protein
MKIAYIISTCEKNFSSRVQYQWDTFLKHVPREDVYYLTAKMDEEKRHFGWDAPDDYYSIPLKYIYFFKNMKIENDYDWYFFPDDDTFIFPNRLEKLLQDYDCNKNIYLGKVLDHIKNQWCYYMSGGAGYLLSKSLYKELLQYVHSCSVHHLHFHYADDLCIGMWIVHIAKSKEVFMINNNDFHTLNHKNNEELKTAITFHEVRDESLYSFYGYLLDREIM